MMMAVVMMINHSGDGDNDYSSGDDDDGRGE